MFGRQAIADGERARSGAASGLGHHAAVARNRARAVAATVEEHQDPALVAAGSDRPFSGDFVEIDGAALDVVGLRPNGPYFVEALPPRCPAGRPRLGAQQRTNGLDLTAVRHARPRLCTTECNIERMTDSRTNRPTSGAAEAPPQRAGAAPRYLMARYKKFF